MTLSVNLRAEHGAVAQVSLAKRAGFDAYRFTARLFEGVGAWLEDLKALQAAGGKVLHCLPLPAKFAAKADLDAYAALVSQYVTLNAPEEVEIGNEPWEAGLSPAQYLKIAQAVMPKLPKGKKVWLGALSQSGAPAGYAGSLDDAGLFNDPRVGLSVHWYEPQKPLGTAMVHALRYYRPVVGQTPILLSETGFQDGECPVVWIDDDLAPPGQVWANNVTGPGPGEFLIDPRGKRSFYTGKGLGAGYRRITVTLRTEGPGWATAYIGAWGDGDEAVEVPVGPTPRVYSMVVKARAHAPGDNPCVYSVQSEARLLSPGRPSVVAVDWTDDDMAFARLKARARETRAAQGWADALGLAGVYPYVLSDKADDTRVFGLLEPDGQDKVALATEIMGSRGSLLTV